MKRPVFTIILLVVAVSLFAQQVPREEVLMEIGTGTWCVYCPGAAMGAHDMIANGHDVAVIEYHSGSSDPFQTNESLARISYYNITGFPTTFFDGTLSHVGGNASSSLYTTFLPLYNQRIVIPCSFTIDICGDNSGDTYDVTLTINKVATYTGTNLKVQLAVTETGIPYSWQNQSTIDYCMRDMVPTDLGTAIDFSGSDEVEVDLTFTLDPTWVTDSCELIAFVQDDDTKEVLQCVKVMVPELMGCWPVPAMSCSDSSICVGNSTNFYDESSGNVVTRQWTFEGGNPATSTDENPVVTYPQDGYFDVTLIVSDDAGYSDTLEKTNYIESKLDPAQCDQPTGPSIACEGQGQDYSTSVVPYTETYNWQISPADAGSVNGTGPTATFNATDGYTGSFEIKVRAENECAIGEWSTVFSGTVDLSPTEYELSPDGGYCEGSSGAELKLYGSEVNIEYELFLDDETTGITVQGTGDTISFGFFTEEGIYTSTGSSTNCTTAMTGMTWVHAMEAPEQADQPEGPETACNNEISEYFTDGASGAVNLIWSIDPPEAGTVIETIEDTARIEWSIDFSGLASITVAGENDCGTGPASDPAETTIYATPQPVVGGEANACSDEEYVYSVQENAGSTYEWIVEGGTIVAGTGTHQITVLWGDPGDGNLIVTETSSEDCIGTSEAFEVTIIICSGINSQLLNQFTMYPNPAHSNIYVEFYLMKTTKYQLAIMNALGQVVFELSENGLTGLQKLNINTSDLPAGYYMLNIKTENGSQIQDKFMKK